MKTVLPFSFFALVAILFLAHTAHAQPASPLDEVRAALNANDLAQAESLLAPLTAADAQDAGAFFTLGQLRERQRKLQDAATAYEKATQLDATKPEYLSALGIALSQRMGELPFMQQAMVAGKMKKAFEKSVALDPRHVPGLIGLTRYYTNAPEIAGGSLTKAAEFAERVKQLVPFLGETELGTIAARDDRFADALAHFEAAAQLKPNDAGLLLRCGRMLAKLDRKDEARARFESALKLNPQSADAAKALAELNPPAN
jgi:Flp pilus assembly protein TadD